MNKQSLNIAVSECKRFMASCHEYERETISDSVKLIGNLFRKNFLSKDMISFEESVYSRLCNNTNQSPEILLDVVKGFYMDDKFQRDVIELYRELVKQPTKDKYESGYWLLLGQPRV